MNDERERENRNREIPIPNFASNDINDMINKYNIYTIVKCKAIKSIKRKCNYIYFSMETFIFRIQHTHTH